MPLLDNAALESLGEVLDQDFEPKADDSSLESKQEEQVTPEPQTEEAPSEESTEVDESGHPIPYGRFKSVVETRNTLRSENDTLKAQLQEMESRFKNIKTPVAGSVEPSPTEQTDWLDDYLAKDTVQSGVPEGYRDETTQYQQLDSRIQQFEIREAQSELQLELQSAKAKYPAVNDDILLHAVIQDPTVDVMDVAEKYNTYVASIEERAIARHLEENKPKAAPRLNGVSSGHTPGSNAAKGKPRTMAEARAAALEFWKTS